MEFRLLGPLEARERDRALPLGGAKQRAVLAVLLLSANEVVSRDRLIDEVWGESPPETAVPSVHVYVSRLRKVLPEATLVTQAPGYLLRADPEQVDVERAERALAEGREALAAGDPARASALLGDALGLWRGSPLAEFAYEPFAQAEIARLEELRSALLEERIEADLALGRHGELVGELERLTALHPLRERLRGQLMLALYRSGRQAEALDAYQAARKTLVDELGIEPGAALQRLEKAVLVQAPALDLPEQPAPAQAAEVEPAPSERKLVTVLFADLGAPAPDDDPERARALLDDVYEAAAIELRTAGGALERGVADALLAVFGAPAAQEDHAERALDAALAVRDRLRERFGASLAVRIGIETGTVLVGGSDGSRLAGRPVTVAAGLVRSARSGEIHVGTRAAAGVRGVFELPARKDAHVLVRRRVPGRSRGVAGLGQAFVGRGAELELLRETLERGASERVPHLASIVGEAGVGKTSLVREVRASSPTHRWHVGRCLPYGRAITYRPLADVLRELLGLQENDPQEAVLNRLRGTDILGLTLGLDVAGDLHPREARDRLHEAWVALLSDAAEEELIVVVVEDLHWAEDALLELLERLVRDVSGPLVLLGTTRPELLYRAPGFGSRVHATRIWLEPLSVEDAGRMIEELAGDLPDSVRRPVLDRAEGNPFFVEELLQTLIDRRTLRREDGAWVVREGARLEVPDTIQAVLAARIDLLPTSEKRALQAAAVVGRSFWERPLRELVEDPDLDLLGLEDRDLVRRRAASALAGEREYEFKHALLRDVAYASVPTDRRAGFHASFAEWLERETGGRDEHVSMLAHHYAAAVRPEEADLAWREEPERAAELARRAVEQLMRAAQLAAGRFELDEALALVDQALELAERPYDVELWRLAARIHLMRFEMSDFRGALERALELDPPRETAAEIYGELAQRGTSPYMWRGPPSRADTEAWIANALELAEPGSRARALALSARAKADSEGRAEAADEALAIAERLDDPELLEVAAFVQGRIASAARDYERLGAWANRQLAAARRLRDPDLRSLAFFVVAIDYLKLGRLADAAALVDEHDEASWKLSAHHRVHVLALRVLAETIGGDWLPARERAAATEEAAEANRDTPCQFDWRSLALCALAAAELGDTNEAERLEGRARELATSGPPGHEPAFIRLALLRRDRDAVARLLEVAPVEGSFWDVDTPASRLDALVALGDRERVETEAAGWLEIPGYTRPFALRALGVVHGDQRLLDQAVSAFDALGLVFRAAETRALA